MTRTYHVSTTRGCFQLVASSAAAAISAALELAGIGSKLIRCTQQSDW